MAEVKGSLVDLKAMQLEYAFERGVNFGKRTITISSDIDHDTFKLIDAALTEMESEKLPVTIRVNSTGGSVYDALAIVGRMKSSKLRIITEAYGAVMSAAVAILAAGNVRKMSDSAWFMSHESLYEAEGRHSDVQRLVEQRKREEQQWAKLMESNSERTAAWWTERHSNGDMYLTARECKKLGIVDHII